LPPVHTIGGGKRFGMGAKPQGVWGRESPSGVQGQSPGRGSGDEVLQKLKKF